MLITLTKPTVLAFRDDISDSLKSLDFAKSQLGVYGDSFKVNHTLALDFGLQLILRGQDMEKLGDVEKNLSAIPESTPLAIHAPYFYDDPETWERGDLTQGRQGLNTLLKTIELANRIGAHSISVHPNSIRSEETLNDPTYTHERRLESLEHAIAMIQEAQAASTHATVDMENKPIPTVTFDKKTMTYTLVFAPLEDLKTYAKNGCTMTFDTAHYALAASTINRAIARLGADLTDERLKAEKMLGYFAKDYCPQPATAEAMRILGPRISHIHLNDASLHFPVPETGLPDRTKKGVTVGGFEGWVDSYAPRNGDFCEYDTITPWLVENQGQDRRVILTLEVSEFDGNYKTSPQTRKAIINAGRTIMGSFPAE